MKIKNKILTLLLSLWWCAGYAQPTLQAEFLAALNAKNTSVETIRCNFTQIKHNTMLAQDAESSGKFYFQRPEKFALLYDKPTGDRIVMGQTDFLIVAGGSRSVVKIATNPLFRQMQQIFTACFSGDIAALSSDGAFRCKKSRGTYTVEIIPESKRARRYISKIVLVFSIKDMLLDELRMDEASDNFTLYRFTNKQTNLPVADSCFDITR
ncbi:MAG: outer membrane lipoprotein carrier protein LolA [Alistipes sp.]